MNTPTQYIHLPGLLNPDQVRRLEEIIAKAEFADGRATAGGAAKVVKNNEQMASGPLADEARQIVLQALNSNPLFQAGAMPRKIYPPIISRYGVGMTYGWHVDGPVMGRDPRVRTDLACTIFLSDPASYDGGELIVTTPVNQVPFKLPKGDAILYPANTVHGVAEVKRGTRIAAVTWIQSMVRQPAQREILFQMQYLMENLQGKDAQSTEAMWATQVYSNLMRMWSEA